MVGTARGVFVIAVADVFICPFNDNGANKQSQIKINFVATPLWDVIRSRPSAANRTRGNFESFCCTL
jgi:hypothetical protein